MKGAPPPPPGPPSSSPLLFASATGPSGPQVTRVGGPRRPRLLGRIATTALVILGLVAVATAGFVGYRFVAGSSDDLATMVPANSAFYSYVLLDPSGTQKLNLYNLLNKFPKAATDASRTKTINQWLDDALKSNHLSHTDVVNWLGTDVAMYAANFGGSGSSTPPWGLLIGSKNDDAATAFLNKFRSSQQSYSYSTTTYGGVLITTLQDSSSAGLVCSGNIGSTFTTASYSTVQLATPCQPFTIAFAVLKNAVVIASSSATIQTIVDTANGHSANIANDLFYKQQLAALPSDRLGVFYINGQALRNWYNNALNNLSSDSPSPAPTPSTSLDGITSMGMSFSAMSNGMETDYSELFDNTLLSRDMQAILAVTPHQNSTLTLVPPSAYGFLTLGGLDKLWQSEVNSLGPTVPDLSSQLDALGLGQDGLPSQFSGDAGFEVEPTTSGSSAEGAFIFGTSKPSDTQNSLDKLAKLLGQVTTTNYKGIVISSVTATDYAGAGAYAVEGNNGIIASSAQEVMNVIDTASGANVTGTSGYQNAFASVSSNNNASYYVNMPKVVSTIRKLLPSNQKATFESDWAPWLDHISLISGSTTYVSGQVSGKILVGVS